MKRSVLLVCVYILSSEAPFSQEARQLGLLDRRYREGEQLTYSMKGVDDGLRYEVRAVGVVKRNPQGKYFEEYTWSNLTQNGVPLPVTPKSTAFRQILSLDPNQTPSVPNLSEVPDLIGPITDLLTFYSDLWLAIRQGNLRNEGDHFFTETNMPASWADGTYITIGESAIDFDITLVAIDRVNQSAKLLVRHVPPKNAIVKLPAAWMREPVAETQNNWVSVRRIGNKYLAAVGKETFDVEMNISLADGRILFGTLDNAVVAHERDCADSMLSDCGEFRSHPIVRQIQISSQP